MLETLVPLSLDLCTDPVAEVRTAAIGQIGDLFAMLLQSESSEGEVPTEQSPVALLLGTICGMASMQSCYKRANFVQICSSLVRVLEVPLVALECTRKHSKCAG